MRALPLAVLSCLLAATPAAAYDPQTLTYALRSETDNFDPAWAFDSVSGLVVANVYENLLSLKAGGFELEPRLATAVPSRANGLVSSDGRVYRFPIRAGVRFHDGSLLTPEDVRYSLLRLMLTDREGGPSGLLLEPVLGEAGTRSGGALKPGLARRLLDAVAVEDGRVVVRLARPFSPFLSVLARYGFVQSRAWCAARGQWDGSAGTAADFNGLPREASLGREAMNGTGPFKLLRHDPVARQTLLARHDGYWRGPARLKMVAVKTVPEFSTRKLLLAAGDADVIEAPPLYAPQLDGMGAVRVIDGLRPLASPYVLYFAQRVDPVANPNIGSGRLDGEGIPPDFFADPDVREGFAFALDYDGYVRDVLRGKSAQAAGVIPPVLLPRAEPRAPRRRLDPDAARAHLRKALGGRVWEKGFRLTLVSNEGGEAALALCQMVKRQIEALNPRFHVDIRVVQWSSMLDFIRQRKLPLHLATWRADYADAHGFAHPFLHSKGHYPSTHGFADAESDRLIEAALAEGDPAERARLYAALEDRADELVPYVPVAHPAELRAQRAEVEGFVFRPMFPGAPGGGDYYDLGKAPVPAARR